MQYGHDDKDLIEKADATGCVAGALVTVLSVIGFWGTLAYFLYRGL